MGVEANNVAKNECDDVGDRWCSSYLFPMSRRCRWLVPWHQLSPSPTNFCKCNYFYNFFCQCNLLYCIATHCWFAQASLMSWSSSSSSSSCQVIITSALDLTHLIMDCLLQSEKGFPKTMKIISELKYLPDLLALYEEIGTFSWESTAVL